MYPSSGNNYYPYLEVCKYRNHIYPGGPYGFRSPHPHYPTPPFYTHVFYISVIITKTPKLIIALPLLLIIFWLKPILVYFQWEIWFQDDNLVLRRSHSIFNLILLMLFFSFLFQVKMVKITERWIVYIFWKSIFTRQIKKDSHFFWYWLNFVACS